MPVAAAAPDPEAPKSISFGTIGLFNRELRVSSWLFEDFPKSNLGTPPAIPFGSNLDLDAVRLRGIPIDRLSLMPGQRRIETRGSARHGFGCELKLKGATGDFKELGYAFEFKCVQPKFEGLRPSLRAREFELFLGGKGGATGTLKFRNGRFEGAALAPGLEGTFGLRVHF